ncbi:MAG: UDP-glucose 4-epimerase GalE [Acidimicrobiia bacterium]|nr:UDP-glucose 4-epimerase GalE [Acidimicrobiia bacterium]
MKVLVTGGTGYIGSHTVVELIEAGHEVVILDNLVNSQPVVVDRISQITGTSPTLAVGDIGDPDLVDRVLTEYEPEVVIHFAGLKAVGESVAQPLRYYRNNVSGTITLLERLDAHEIRKLVFSSSATVYGDPQTLPITEDAPLSAVNPYGGTKLQIEQVLRDVAVSDDRWRFAALRYFNPAGAHVSGLMGEDPTDTPNNLLPYITQVAVGRREKVRVFGDDYDTPDGTGVRDYVHVVDLARGHLAAIETMSEHRGFDAWNLGTGVGTSVLELINTFSEVNGVEVPYEIVDRRSGDSASSYTDPAKAHRDLGWKATHDLAAMCRDSWRWQSQNPEGYGG